MNESKAERPRLGSKAGLAGLVLAVAVAGVRFAGAAGGPADIDEVYWIGSAYYFDLAVMQGRPLHPDWGLLPARENPPAGKYLIGAALATGRIRVTGPDRLAAFYLHFSDRPGAWGGVESIAKRRAVVDRVAADRHAGLGRLGTSAVSDAELRLGRRLMVAAGLAATAGVVALGWLASGPTAGTLAGLLFAMHPISRMTATRVSVDMPAVAFSVAAMLALALLLRGGGGEATGRGRVGMAGLAAGLGVTLALACATKMTAAVVVMTAILAWAGLILARGPRWRRPRRAMTGALVLSAAAFLAINPTFYPDPIGGVLAVFREGRINVQVLSGFLDGALRDVPDRLRALADLVCRRSWLGPPLAAAALVQTATAARRGRPGMVVVCLWWWVAVAAVGAWLPFAWPRYALPLLPPTAVLVASMTVEIARRLAERLGGAASPRS